MLYIYLLFSNLFATDFGKSLAVSTFQAHRSGYHPVCATMLAKDLELDAS
jgi:hypothetical protein